MNCGKIAIIKSGSQLFYTLVELKNLQPIKIEVQKSPVAVNILKSNEMEVVTNVALDERVGFTAGGKEIGPQVTKNIDANCDLKPGDKAVQSSKFGHWNSFINGFFFGQQQGNK